jgi:multidrug resistance protein, MATE family
MFSKSNYKELLMIALPIMAGMISQNIIQITNTAFLGRIGSNALGVSAMGGLFYMLLSVLSWGFSSGTQILVARRLGEKKFSEIGSLIQHNTIILLVYAVVAFLILQIGSSYFLHQIVANKIVADDSISFLKIRSFGIFITVLISILNSFYIGLGRTKVLMYSTVVTAIVNIFLDYALIFGHFGFSELGTDGAAYASNIAELLGLLVLAINFVIYKYANRFSFSFFNKLQKDKFMQLLNLSLPMVLQFSFSFGAWYVFFIVLENMGEMQVAIANIMRSILFLFTISCWAIGSSCNSLVSNKIGKKRMDEVIPLIKSASSLSFIISLLFSIVLIVFAKSIMQIYTTNTDIIEGAIHPIFMLAGCILLLSISTVMFQGVQGTGNTKYNLLVELIAIIFYLIYVLGFVKRLQLSLTLAWASELIYWIIIALMSYFYLISNKWKNKVL